MITNLLVGAAAGIVGGLACVGAAALFVVVAAGRAFTRSTTTSDCNHRKETRL